MKKINKNDKNKILAEHDYSTYRNLIRDILFYIKRQCAPQADIKEDEVNIPFLGSNNNKDTNLKVEKRSRKDYWNCYCEWR